MHTFRGGDAEHAELLDRAARDADWAGMLHPSDLMMSSAACHALYPTLPRELPPGGHRAELQGFCFRHEPSSSVTRMQSFRMHELVRIGSPAAALDHRDATLEAGLAALSALGLVVWDVPANDPFFGRAGRLLARNQRSDELKFEILCEVDSAEHPTAIASANLHLDHFGEPFGIRTADGEPAHSACFAFGLDRIALALFATHGPRTAAGRMRSAHSWASTMPARAEQREDAGHPEAVPLWFGPSERRAFGWVHRPAHGQARSALVMCSSLGQEAHFAHYAYKGIAEALARRDVLVIRFDHCGTGDAQDVDAPRRRGRPLVRRHRRRHRARPRAHGRPPPPARPPGRRPPGARGGRTA